MSFFAKTECDCKECENKIPAGAKACQNCGALAPGKSPLLRLSYFYFGGGVVFIGLYAYLLDVDGAKSIVVRWLAVGFALGMIVYGRSKRHESEVAALIYLTGLALLAILMVVGIYLIWDQGIILPEIQKWFSASVNQALAPSVKAI